MPSPGAVRPDWPEDVNANALICHDCRRDLVADSTFQRVLVCPTLHGRRPPGMAPTNPDGAVECGHAA